MHFQIGSRFKSRFKLWLLQKRERRGLISESIIDFKDPRDGDKQKRFFPGLSPKVVISGQKQAFKDAFWNYIGR